jgi:hypothetical protein
MIKRLPSTGVPVGAATVKATACAVKTYWSFAEMSGVSVDVDVVLDTRGLIRLLVSVAVLSKVTAYSEGKVQNTFIVLPAKLISAVVFNELDKTVVLDNVLPEAV